MAEKKLPRDMVLELDKLVETLAGDNPEERHVAMSRLESFEKGGKIPLDVLMDMADETNPSMMMYGITALGRNKTPPAVRKLIELVGKHKEGHQILLETVVDALGETGDRAGAPALLELMGIELGLGAKVRSLVRRKKQVSPEQQRRREVLALPVVRAVEKMGDPKASTAVAGYLGNEDSVVRWHAIRAIANAKITDFNDKLRDLAAEDEDEVVREAAQIALNELSALPRHLNN